MKRSLLISIILLLLCVILISCGDSTVPEISGKTTDSQTEHTVIEDSQTDKTGPGQSETDPSGTEPGQSETEPSETEPGETETEPGTPAHSHTIVIDAAVEPTCSETGLTEGSHCSVCGEIIKAQEVIPATGNHAYDSGICTVCGSQNIIPIYLIDSDGELVAEGFCRNDALQGLETLSIVDLFFLPLDNALYEDYIYIDCDYAMPYEYYKFAKQGFITQVNAYTTDGLPDVYSEITYDAVNRMQTTKYYDIYNGVNRLEYTVFCSLTENGQMEEYIIQDATGTITQKMVFTYSSNRIFCEDHRLNSGELTLAETHEFHLNSEGRPIYYKNVYNIAEGYADEYRYTYNEKGNLLLCEWKDEDGWYYGYRYEYDSLGFLTAAYEYEDLLFTRELELDRDGRVTSISFFDENGTQTSEIKKGRSGGWLQQFRTREVKVLLLSATETTFYQYDESDRLIKEEIHQKFKGTGAEIIYTVSHEYDARGNQTKITSLLEDGTLNWREEYEYDDMDRRTSIISYNASEEVTDHHEFEYYDNSMMKTNTMYYPDGTISTKTEYRPDGTELRYTDYNEDGSVNYLTVYNEAGLPVSKTGYNRSGEIDNLTLYEDGISMVILSTTYDSSGEVATVTENEYDEHNNLVRSVVKQGSSGELASVTEKEYDEEDRLARSVSKQFFTDGTLSYVTEDEYEQGRYVRSISKQYNNDGTFVLYECTYHANGSVATWKKTDSDGRIISEQKYDENWQQVYYADYDEHGILFYGYIVVDGEYYPLVEDWYDSETGTDYRLVYGYDDAGNKTSIHYYLENGTLDGYVLGTYDAKGNILTEIYYTADDEVNYTCLYSYDSEGRLLEYLEYDENRDEVLRQEYSYSGNEATILVYNYGVYTKWVKRTFNENGQIEKDIFYDTNDEAYYERDYVYDEDGVLIDNPGHSLP